MRVDFYQLVAAPDAVVARIAQRVTDAGGRLLVIAAADGLEALDEALWRQPGATFLPHGRAGDADAADQPILLADASPPAGARAENGARNIVVADGRWRDEALSYERAFHLFGGDATAAAREAWRALAGRDDVERRFWKQDDAGKWAQAG